MKTFTNIHLWYNSDYSSHKIRAKINDYNIISHQRPHSLDRSYMTHIIHTITQKQFSKDLHILVLTNRDVQIYHPEILSEFLDLLFKVSQCRDQSRLSKFICIDILHGKSDIIKNSKRQILETAWQNQNIGALHDLGWDLTPTDIFTRSKLTAAGNRKIENQILDIINMLLWFKYTYGFPK